MVILASGKQEFSGDPVPDDLEKEILAKHSPEAARKGCGLDLIQLNKQINFRRVLVKRHRHNRIVPPSTKIDPSGPSCTLTSSMKARWPRLSPSISCQNHKAAA